MISLFQFKRRNFGQVFAWATYDFANSAFATTILAVIFNVYYARVVAGGADGTEILGVRIPGASLFTIFVAAAMVLVALSAPILAALSDIGGLKKRMLAVHLGLGVVATTLLITVGEGEWLWGGLLFVIGQIGFAGGNIFYNSMLQDIAEPEDYGKVSGLGWAWGYIGGGLLLCVNLIMLQYPQVIGMPPGSFTVQDCFISVAIWWALFSLPVFRSVPSVQGTDEAAALRIRTALTSLKTVFVRLRELPHFARFFIAFLLYNDGIETVIIMASIFGDQELHMSSASLILFFLLIQGVAFVGSLIFGWLADKLGNKRTIQISLFGWLIVVVWGWQLGIFGNPLREYWLLGVVAGLVMGGSQAASRSLQAALIPPEKSAEFFSFFGISGRFASAVGPALFGLAVFLTGSLRAGILSLIIFFAGGYLILLMVNEKIGHQQALDFRTTPPPPFANRIAT